MTRSLIAIGVILIALLLAWAYQRRNSTYAASPSVAPTYSVPKKLERWDFTHPNHNWLLVVFTSKSCSTCAGVINAAQQLASSSVAIQEVEYNAQRDLHARYGIAVVPLVILVDKDGMVVASHAGAATAEELAKLLTVIR